MDAICFDRGAGVARFDRILCEDERREIRARWQTWARRQRLAEKRCRWLDTHGEAGQYPDREAAAIATLKEWGHEGDALVEFLGCETAALIALAELEVSGKESR